MCSICHFLGENLFLFQRNLRRYKSQDLRGEGPDALTSCLDIVRALSNTLSSDEIPLEKAER